jgi:hypothetical protein
MVGDFSSILMKEKNIHVHAQKYDMECKFWILVDEVEIKQEYGFNLTASAKREIKKIIYQHFYLIIDSWNKYFNAQKYDSDSRNRKHKVC